MLTFLPKFGTIISGLLIFVTLRYVCSIQVILKPEDILALEETTIIQMKTIWNHTHATYALYGTNTTNRIKIFWSNLKNTLSVATLAIRAMDRRILDAQPNRLLNTLFKLQELDVLKDMSDMITNDPIIQWKVKWVEVSSLSTHIHWLFNKRVRDIFNNVPYIKTIANSLAKYYGNPWYAKLSGRTNDAHRYPMRDFPRWLDSRTFSMKQDLFFGLRKLIDDCELCKTASSVQSGACLGKDTLAEIEPLRLDSPIYVFFYLCLVDIKFYILKNMFHIYREAYENIPYTSYSIFDDRLQTRIRKKIESYSDSFKDYDIGDLNSKVSRGYFNCDPQPTKLQDSVRAHVYKKTYIKLTNFATEFVVLERDLTPSGTCAGTCKTIGKLEKENCNKTESECMAELYPECKTNPRLCELFKPTCSLEHLTCYKSASNVKTCPSHVPGRLLEWTLLNNTSMYPKDAVQNCSHRIREYNSSTTIDPITKKLENCEVCLCQCLEPLDIRGNKNSVRTFSLKEAIAVTKENRVVVGIKFEQIQDQIHIMIADAVLLPDYEVDMSTAVWRTPKLADADNPYETVRIGRNLRAMHIDDWKAPSGHVLTGVRFLSASAGSLDTHDYQPYIGIAIQVTKVDKTSGKLLKESKWITSPSYVKTPYKYLNPDDPIKADGPALPDSATNQIIYFRTTALTKTNVNEVIPFFDAQKVIIQDKPSALKGLGIYHKVKPGYGGFLGFKIMLY